MRLAHGVLIVRMPRDHGPAAQIGAADAKGLVKAVRVLADRQRVPAVQAVDVLLQFKPELYLVAQRLDEYGVAVFILVDAGKAAHEEAAERPAKVYVPVADLTRFGIAVVHAGVDHLAQIVARLVRVGLLNARRGQARKKGVRRRLIGDAAAKQQVQRGLRHVAFRVRLLRVGKGGERQLGLRHVGDSVGVRVVHGLEPQVVGGTCVDPHLRRRFVVHALELFQRVVAGDAHPDGKFLALCAQKSARLIPRVGGKAAHVVPRLPDRFPGGVGGVADGIPRVPQKLACRVEEVALLGKAGQRAKQQQRRQQQTETLFHAVSLLEVCS